MKHIALRVEKPAIGDKVYNMESKRVDVRRLTSSGGICYATICYTDHIP